MNADKTDVLGEGLSPVFQSQANVCFPSVILIKKKHMYICMYIRILPANTNLLIENFATLHRLKKATVKIRNALTIIIKGL